MENFTEKDFNSLVEKITEQTGVEINKQVSAALEGLPTEKLKELAEKDVLTSESLDGLVGVKDVANLTAQMKDLTEKMDQIVDAGGQSAKSQVEQIAEEIKENKDTLIKIAKGDRSIKHVMKTLVLRSAVATNIIGLDLPGIGQYGRPTRGVYDFLAKQVIPLPADHAGIIRYRDWVEGSVTEAAANVAEGAAFPESAAAWKGYTLAVEKIGDSIPVTEEFFEDEPTLAAELNLFLTANVLDAVDNQVVNGTGTSPQIHSLDSRSPNYAAAAAGIADPNIYDLMVKLVEAITAARGNKYQPDFIAMNIADINLLRLHKDANNNYIFSPQTGLGSPITIVEDNNVTANEAYIGDSRFVRLYEMPGVELSQGFVGTQFTEDEMTLKARKRLAFLIREADLNGFLHVPSISAALTTLAT